MLASFFSRVHAPKRLIPSALLLLAVVAATMSFYLPRASATTTVMRGAYSIGPSEAAANNMNLVVGNSATLSTLDSLKAAGVQGIVWLGDCYKQADGTMGFRMSDDQIRSTVGAIKGHSAIYAYEVCDEPNNNMGSDAKAKVKARSDLIKSIDPSKPTFTVIGGYGPYGGWAGLVDILGIDPYPARWGTFKLSDMQAALDSLRADAARLPRVIGIYQTFADSVAYTPMPSAAQVKQQLDLMIGSGLLEGVAAYEWTKGHQWTTDWANIHADVVETIKSVYGSMGGTAPAPTPTPTPTPTAPTAGDVTGLTLVNADTDTDIGPLAGGSTINLATLPTRNLNVRANVSGTVESVRFSLNGSVNSVESVAPYAMAGDTNGDYGAWTPAVGSQSIGATPFTADGAGGTAGTTATVSFTVVDQASAPAPEPSPTPTADTTPPSPPGWLQLGWLRKSVALTWGAATDNVGVVAYRVYRDGVLVATTSSLGYTDRPSWKLSHSYAVRAVDAAGNVSQPVSGSILRFG